MTSDLRETDNTTSKYIVSGADSAGLLFAVSLYPFHHLHQGDILAFGWGGLLNRVEKFPVRAFPVFLVPPFVG